MEKINNEKNRKSIGLDPCGWKEGNNLWAAPRGRRKKYEQEEDGLDTVGLGQNFVNYLYKCTNYY